ncbi:MAG: hypothetical protein ACLQPH_11975 [Acidimicrobiales bacterium]
MADTSVLQFDGMTGGAEVVVVVAGGGVAGIGTAAAFEGDDGAAVTGFAPDPGLVVVVVVVVVDAVGTVVVATGRVVVGDGTVGTVVVVVGAMTGFAPDPGLVVVVVGGAASGGAGPEAGVAAFGSGDAAGLVRLVTNARADPTPGAGAPSRPIAVAVSPAPDTTAARTIITTRPSRCPGVDRPCRTRWPCVPRPWSIAPPPPRGGDDSSRCCVRRT